MEWRFGMSKRSLLILFLTVTLFIGFAAAQDNENATAKYGILDVSRDLNLSAFSSALEGVGFAGTLDNEGVLVIGDGSFVVFAPSDDAFSSVTDVDINSIMANQTEAKQVLGYHIVWNDGLFENVSQVSSAKTLQGENLTLENDNGLTVNGAMVLQSREYDNGTVYVIDSVLLPEGRDAMGVLEAADEFGDLTKFTAAIKSAGFVDRLNGQGLLGIGDLAEGPFTIFAPNDAAFNQVPKSVMDPINKQQSLMRTLLSYHMVDAEALANLTDMGSVKTLEGDSLAVDSSMKLVGGANVLGSTRYDNGIIYEIDQVLIPVRLSLGM
jgi:transforming growth factor-beta-induced protein